jgi:hypothetical protein
MNDLQFPATPREIARAKLSMLYNQTEFIRSKAEQTSVEKDWLAWVDGRCKELENEV